MEIVIPFLYILLWGVCEYCRTVVICLIAFFLFWHKTSKERQNVVFINYDLMTGHEFEYFCADLLVKNDFSDVRITKSSGDFGVDVLAKKNGLNYAIQCKHYSSKVGNKAVQEAYSGRDFYRANVAVVMTNNYFTKAAIETAYRLGVELWDRRQINKLIENAKK